MLPTVLPATPGPALVKAPTVTGTPAPGDTQPRQYILVYDWVNDTYLQEAVAALKSYITAGASDPIDYYAATPETLSLYYSRSDTVIFFITSAKLISWKQKQTTLPPQLPSLEEMQAQLNTIPSFSLHMQDDGRQIVIFAGNAENDLLAVIRSEQVRYF